MGEERAKAVGSGQKDHVARRMAMNVVHGLEPVQIDQKDGAGYTRRLEPRLDEFLEQAPVGKARQGIVPRHLLRLRLGAIPRHHLATQLERLADGGGNHSEAHADAEQNEVGQAISEHGSRQELEQAQHRARDPHAGADHHEAQQLVELAFSPRSGADCAHEPPPFERQPSQPKSCLWVQPPPETLKT